MKGKSLVVVGILIGLLGIVFPASSFAAIHEFIPNPANIYNLDHTRYYTWGISWMPDASEVIVQSELTIDHINNWTSEANDKLYIHLMDDATPGITTYIDNQGGGDNIALLPGLKVLLDTYTDLNDYPGPAENYKHPFTSNELTFLTAFAGDGDGFGIGFDPDCQYENWGVKLTITTKSNVVPEPATMMLMTTGLMGFGLRRRFRK